MGPPAEFLSQGAWARARECAFLTSSQVLRMLGPGATLPRGAKSQFPRSVHTTLMTQTQHPVLPSSLSQARAIWRGRDFVLHALLVPTSAHSPALRITPVLPGSDQVLAPAQVSSPVPSHCVPLAPRSLLCCSASDSQNCKEQRL